MSMSLWNIEQGLADLMEQREELLANDPFDNLDREAHAARLVDIDLAIAEYVKAEVRKVDNIRGLVKHLEMIRDAAWKESDVMKNRAQAADRQLTVLKSAIQVTMEEMEWREGKLRKLEGKTGSISLKGNGGRQPVVITDEALIPEEYKRVTLTFDAGTMPALVAYLKLVGSGAVGSGWRVTMEPNLTAIGNALSEPCAACDGSGSTPEDREGLRSYRLDLPCSACGGSGKNGVPGAILAPRGQHVEVK